MKSFRLGWHLLMAALPADSKYRDSQEFKLRYRLCFKAYADMDGRIVSACSKFVVVPYAILATIGVVYVPLYLNRSNPVAVTGSTLVAMLTFCVFYQIIRKSRSPRAPIYAGLSVLAVIYLTSTAYGRAYQLYTAGVPSHDVAWAAILISFRTIAMSSIAFLMIPPFGYLISAIDSRLWRREAALAKVTYLLVQVLVHVAHSRKTPTWSHYYYIRDALGQASALMRGRVPMLAGKGQLAQYEAVRERCQQASYYIDTLRLSAIMPTSDGPGMLLIELAELCATLTCGHLGDLPICVKPEVTRKRRVAAAILVIRSVTIAFLPVILVSVARLARLPLSDTVTNWATVGSVVWAVISILILVDPLVRDKLILGGNIIDLLRGKSDVEDKK